MRVKFLHIRTYAILSNVAQQHAIKTRIRRSFTLSAMASHAGNRGSTPLGDATSLAQKTNKIWPVPVIGRGSKDADVNYSYSLAVLRGGFV